MTTWTLEVRDLAETVLEPDAPSLGLSASWELDGPGSIEVDHSSETIAPDISSTGLEAWYDANDLASLSDGALVGRWPDRSGNSRDMTQTTDANKPTVLLAGIGGRPSVRFGTQKALNATFVGMTACTYIVVGRYFAGGSSLNNAIVFGNADPRVGLMTDADDSVAPHALRARSNGFVTNWSAQTSDDYLDLQPWLAVLRWNGSTGVGELWVDGALRASGTGSTGVTLHPSWRMGAGIGAGAVANCDLSEVRVYSRALSDAEVTQLARHLAQKWHLSSPEGLWVPGRRRVILYRDGVPVWGGHLEQVEQEMRAGRAEYRARGRGWRAALEDRIVLGDFTRSSTVATTIAWDLIQHAQAQPNGSIGITLGTVTGTAPARTRTYCDGDAILDAIDELASKEPGGFDWEISADRKWNAWVGGRGSDLTASVTFGPGDVIEWQATGDVTGLATYATALGDSDQPCGPPLVTRSGALASSYVRRDAVVDLSSSDTAELTAHADNELAVRARGRLRLRVVVADGADPKGLASLGLGDKVTCLLDPIFGGTQAVRLIAKALSLEPPSAAWWTLTFEVAS